jgi:hypothetical protein
MKADDIQIGDIIIERNFNFWTIFSKRILPKTLLNWPSGRMPKLSSIHNAIMGKRNNILGVFEATPGRYVHFSSWEKYTRRIKNGEIEIKIVRMVLNDEEKISINNYLNQTISRKIFFDMMGSFSLFVNFILGRPFIHRQIMKKYYCTELIANTYKNIGKDFLGKLPSPYDIEKEVAKGNLQKVCDLY